MPITIICGGCAEKIEMPDRDAGQPYKCKCGRTGTIPGDKRQKQPAEWWTKELRKILGLVPLNKVAEEVTKLGVSKSAPVNYARSDGHIQALLFPRINKNDVRALIGEKYGKKCREKKWSQADVLGAYTAFLENDPDLQSDDKRN